MKKRDNPKANPNRQQLGEIEAAHKNVEGRTED